jgi:hypothetical protein
MMNRNTVFMNVIRELKDQPDSIYVIAGSDFAFGLLFRASNLKELGDLTLAATGALSQSPLNHERLRGFGIDNLVTAFGSHANLRLICNPSTAPLIAAQVSSRCKKQVEASEVLHRYFGRYKSFDSSKGHYWVQRTNIWVYRLSAATPQ